jgi:hypothetical protein
LLNIYYQLVNNQINKERRQKKNNHRCHTSDLIFYGGCRRQTCRRAKAKTASKIFSRGVATKRNKIEAAQTYETAS